MVSADPSVVLEELESRMPGAMSRAGDTVTFSVSYGAKLLGGNVWQRMFRSVKWRLTRSLRKR